MRKPSFTLQIEPELNPAHHPPPELSLNSGLWRGAFKAMASDCEILIEGCGQSLAEYLLRIAAVETWRIEFKYSRYRHDNVMAQINHSNGKEIALDSETSALLDFADQCYQLSDGLFDISSGVLRKIWHFDGSDNLPMESEITDILTRIGWQKVQRKIQENKSTICLQEGMELDLGGLGKEYAVDRSLFLIQQALFKHTPRPNNVCSVLVNYGGDLACSGPRLNGEPWQIAVESIRMNNKSSANVRLSKGGIATSGDANRYLLKDGIRYSHVLNPLTGHSITDAPHSVSVAGETCMQAGMLSTIASLYGTDAKAFLEAQEVEYWLQR